MRILALDSALARCSATVVAGGHVMAAYQQDLNRGHAALLPGMTRDALRDAAIEGGSLDLIAVTVGPGSFTGVRGCIALALGISVSTGVPVVGVTVGEALADQLPDINGRALWCAITSRRGRVFLETADQIRSVAIAELPHPVHPVAIAGDAAIEVASRLAARHADVLLTDARLPLGRSIARVGERRFLGHLPPLEVKPLYVDPPEARAPASGLPPPPTG